MASGGLGFRTLVEHLPAWPAAACAAVVAPGAGRSSDMGAGRVGWHGHWVTQEKRAIQHSEHVVQLVTAGLN